MRICRGLQDERQQMMTEKEKARAGFLYDANHNAEIDEDHLKAMDLCYESKYLPLGM